MGKICILLAAVMLSLFLFPKSQVNGASLENPLQRMRRAAVVEENVEGGEGLDYDYAFFNQPTFGGMLPTRLSKTMKRHGRLMKRLRRNANGDNSAIPANKIPAGCCSCGEHYCCDSMCHGK